jgi:hypothetical protein
MSVERATARAKAACAAFEIAKANRAPGMSTAETLALGPASASATAIVAAAAEARAAADALLAALRPGSPRAIRLAAARENVIAVHAECVRLFDGARR